MLTVIPFCNKDKPIAVHLAEWIAELGGVKAHDCMLVHPPTTEPSGVMEPLREAFKKLYILRTPDDEDGWPQGPNLLFRRAAIQIEATSPQPWLWLEPDAIPVVAYWLDAIEGEYKSIDPKRPFLGVRVEIPKIIPHMSGVAAYPGNAPSLAPLLVTCRKVAFDVNGSSQVLPKLTSTALIQHEWKPPTFATAGDLSRVRDGVVIYHQCKDSSLIARLRELRGGVPELLETDKAALADIGGGTFPHGAGTVQTLSPEELIKHHVGQLRDILKAGGEEGERVKVLYAALVSFGLAGVVAANGEPGVASLKFRSEEDAVEQLVGHLKRIYDGSKNDARMVAQYLAAAGVIPSSPLAPPKGKKGPKTKGRRPELGKCARRPGDMKYAGNAEPPPTQSAGLTEAGERVPPIAGDPPCGVYDPAGEGAGAEADGHPQCATCGHPKSAHPQ